MERLYKTLEFVYCKVVLLTSASSLGVLFLISIISTCFIASDQNEFTFFCNDNILVNVIFLVVFSCVFIKVAKSGFTKSLEKNLEDDNYYKWLKIVMLFIMMIVGLLWVIGTQYIPGSDQLDVMSSAYKLYIGENNMLEPGGYLDRCSNQIGITMIEYFMCKLVGYYNFLFIQVLNVFGILVFYKTLIDIWSSWGASRLTQLRILLCGILFFPLTMYASFVYGTVWSLSLAVLAFYAEEKYFNQYKFRYIVWSAIALGVAYQIKNNVLIIFIAMLIFGIMRTLSKKEHFVKGLAIVIAICLSIPTFGSMPRYIINKMTGYTLNQGMSSWSYIAMGLQDEEHMPGWNNGYNYSTYYDSGCITEIQEKVAKEEIINRKERFSNDKRYAFRFFTMKIASMWNEPTYQSFWINQIRNHRVNFAVWIELFMSAKGYTITAKMMKFFQIYIYSGTLLWLTLERKTNFYKRTFFILCFLGGFMFHMFWEAKSQYSLPYVAMLIPYAVMGYGLLSECILKQQASPKSVFEAINYFTASICLVTYIAFSMAYFKNDNDYLTSDSDIYYTYIEQWETPYTAESVLDINIIKAKKKEAEDTRDYYKMLLEQNGISY